MTMASLLSQPPLQDEPLQMNKTTNTWDWTPNYVNWFSEVYNVMADYLVSGRSTLPATLDGAISLLAVPQYPTTQINSIVNPDNGLLVYDTTTDQLKVRKPSGWVVIV
jgi:hypothetical protein